MAEADDLLAEGRKLFDQCAEAENDNRTTGKEDIRFAREGIQWPDKIAKDRETEGRPCLTINKLPAFIRQVVNDARQNKPSIKVHPVDSNADPETAEIINGLIRNIEYTSNADVAYDTATECAVTNGFGYIRVGLDYAYDDSFDMDLSINRVRNPFSVYGDPNSMAADSSDWDVSFVVDRLTETQFKRDWGDKATVDWNDVDAWGGTSWRDGRDTVLVAEWWSREKIDKPILQLSNGMVIGKEEFAENTALQVLVQAGALQVKAERTTKSCKVTQRFMSGAEVLETRDWPGRYIPIIPVYGDEFDIEGKRYLRSLVHNAVDAQRMFNYWRTTSTELVALAPRVPYIGPVGAFATDPNWATANTKSHPYLEHDVVAGANGPQRQPLDMGVAAGALQEALNASDDIKAIIGMYDASLGARSNETSGKAIMARQREGDVSTFHFIDNMSRAIRHTGRVLLDLIPHVYNAERVVRVIGEDGKERAATINGQTPKMDPNGQPVQQQNPETGAMEPVMVMHDLTIGKYDLVVKAGPSFTTQREEAVEVIQTLIQAYPPAAPILAPELLEKMDWPGAQKIAEKLQQQGQLPPEVQKLIEDGKAEIADLQQQLQAAKMDRSLDEAKLAADVKAAEVEAANKVRIAMIEIAADKQIAIYKADADKEVATYKAGLQAQVAKTAAANRPQPQQ